MLVPQPRDLLRIFCAFDLVVLLVQYRAASRHLVDECRVCGVSSNPSFESSVGRSHSADIGVVELK